MNAGSELDDALLPARKVWERYGVSDRTLDRWIDRDGFGFPKPVIILRKRYFRIRELVAWERERAAEKSEAA